MVDELRSTFKSDWSEVERLNHEAMAFLSTVPLPDPAVDTYTMVICELIENSIKYGRLDDEIDLAVQINNGVIEIQVRNKVDSDARQHLRELDRTLQRLRGVQDPYQAYLERIREISREPMDDDRSCLGLVRVVCEGRANLDFVLDEEDTLNVSAIARLQ